MCDAHPRDTSGVFKAENRRLIERSCNESAKCGEGRSMLRRKIAISGSMIVWRMTATDVVAVDIDLTELTFVATTLDLADRGWLESSCDLQH